MEKVNMNTRKHTNVVGTWLLAFGCWLLALTGAQATVTFNGPTWYDYRDQSFAADGEGTLLNPIVVSTPEQLAQVAWLVNEQGNRFTGKVFVLASDISLQKEADGKRVVWQPIGLKNAFEGVFLGIDTREDASTKRHSISGLYIDATLSSTNDPRFYGLFGRCDGFVGYLQLRDASVKVVSMGDTWNKSLVDVGLLCGRCENIENLTFQEKAGGQKHTLVPGFTDIAVEGTLNVDGGDYSSIGAVCSYLLKGEISHSTAKVTIVSNGFAEGIGGICGSIGYDVGFEVTLLDCAADVNFSCTSRRTKYMGGVVGIMNPKTNAKACSSTGTIRGYLGEHTGGIAGLENYDSTVRGCVSTVSFINNSGTVSSIGGIVGQLGMFSGHAGTLIEGCAYAGHIDGSEAFYVGGICGDYLGEDNEHIKGDLFLGTITPSTLPSSYTGAIVGRTPKPIETVVGCYYDRQLFSGQPVGGTPSVLTIKGLSTTELTSGQVRDIPLLPTDDTGEYGFTLRDGFYPKVFCKSRASGNQLMAQNSLTGKTANKLLGSDLRTDNSLYQPVAWLATIPVKVRRGDCADDFVSTLSVSSVIDDSWTEADGRTVSIYNDSQLPDAACIDISETTATAKANGTCLITIDGQLSAKGGSELRPAPLGCSRQVWVKVTIDRVWDGTIATACAEGTGAAEDPFIIKTGAQLAYAVRNNKAGEFYEQICDIRLNEQAIREDGITRTTDHNWKFGGEWSASYDGGGHFVRAAEIVSPSTTGYALFGNITDKGSVSNLGMVESSLYGVVSALAYNMDGKITNCLVHGIYESMPNDPYKDGRFDLGHGGGICYAVGPNNPEAVIEDCVTAMFSSKFLSDYTPFVSLSPTSKGVVRNSLAVVPTAFANLAFEDRELYSAAGHDFISNCYWLKGYEAANSGYTLDDINDALGRRRLWQTADGYFPMLKTFAHTDLGKLLSIPVHTDEAYEPSASFLLGFSRHLTFEPGQAVWTSTDTNHLYFDIDGDMGVIAPIRASFVAGADFGNVKVRQISGLYYMRAQYGKTFVLFPLCSSDVNVSPGITFVDPYARQACLAAFDANHDGHLSLPELEAVTTEQTLNAFDTWESRQIKEFPEFRFFKNVTELTSQLNGLTNLREVKLPYALQTLGSEAFKNCTKLTTVTMPSKLTTVKAGAFLGSSVDTILVDHFNEKFVSRDGLLFTKQNELVAWPNGRKGEEATVEGTVKLIAAGAFYKVPGLRRLYFETTNFNTAMKLTADGIVTDDGSMADVYISDATHDRALMTKYERDASWAQYVRSDKLHAYHPLKIEAGLAGTDNYDRPCYFGSFCIGFDTILPEGLTPYIVEEADRDHFKAYLTERSNAVPAMAAVVVAAPKPGTYRLVPADTQIAPWPLYDNRLLGADRNGRWVNQQTSAQGSILSLGYASGSTTLGFYPERGKQIEPFRAYLPFNTVDAAPEVAANSHYDIVYTTHPDEYKPYVLWFADTKTLVFTASTIAYRAGSSYEGQRVTSVWSNEQVTQSGATDAPWVSTAREAKRVEIHFMFKSVTPTSMHGWFSRMNSLETIEGLDYVNTSQVTDMTSVFFGCGQLKELDLSEFDTRNVTHMDWMFYQCWELTTIFVDKNLWDMSRVGNTANMFSGDSKLRGQSGTTYSPSSIDGNYARIDEGPSKPGYLSAIPDVALIDGGDNSAALEKYTGRKVNVTYNRVLSAQDNGDGTWSPKAYTVCLPYDFVIHDDVEVTDKINLYHLVSVTDDYEYIFTNDINYIMAGFPYVVVVSKGSFRLDAQRVILRDTPVQNDFYNYVYDSFGSAGPQVGWWRGTFRNITNEEGSAMHAFCQSSDGNWRVIRNDEEKYRTGYIPTFRAFFVPLEHKNNHLYYPRYIYTEAGDTPNLDMTLFPATAYDGDLPAAYADDTATQGVIHTIDRDGTHCYFDLQGRQLPSRPAKGLYIKNGNKVIR